MKILLTGPTGFIGSTFAGLALQHGHTVAGLILPSESIPQHLPKTDQLVWLRGTLETAPWKEIEEFNADVCVHTAWITTPGVYLESPENLRFRDASAVFLRKAQALGINHIVALGTCIEYRISNAPLSEATTRIEPATTYARCKNDLRVTLEADAQARGVTFCWGRVFYPYGPREHPSRLCSSIITKLSRDEKILLRTPGSTKDYVYIADLADAILTLVEKKFSGPINLGTGVGVTVRDIAQTLAELMGKSGLVEEAHPPEVDPLGFVVADASRLRQLGWRATNDLRAGLEKLLRFRQQAQASTQGA